MKRVALATAMALGLSPAVYAALDLIESWRAPESDPSLMLHAEHHAFLGRLLVASYVTVLVGFAMVRVRPSDRAIVAAVCASSAALLLEGALRS